MPRPTHSVHAVINALTIARELPGGWLAENSMFSDEFDRLCDAAHGLAELETEERVMWDTRDRPGYESFCARLAHLVRESPYRPITKTRVKDLLLNPNHR